jgi:hypothetical protein
MPRLTKEDWKEIYYALDTKLHRLLDGHYDVHEGEVEECGSETQKWAAHLGAILEKIGPDGRRMVEPRRRPKSKARG